MEEGRIEEIKNKIVETYLKYRDMVLSNYENPRHLQVVIQMKPETFLKLRSETTIYNNREILYIELYGRKTPILIDDRLEEHVEFKIQSRYDYERQEQEKLMKRFFKMFDE